MRTGQHHHQLQQQWQPTHQSPSRHTTSHSLAWLADDLTTSLLSVCLPLFSLLLHSCLAGTLPSEFSLGGGFDDVDSVQRREPESRSWESDDDDDERVHRMDETSGGEVVNDPLPAADGGVIVAPHPPPPIHTHPSLSVSPIRIDSSGAASPDRSSGDSSRAPSPTLEVKHQMFEKKRAGNYGHMGDLLKRRQQQDEDDDDE